MAARADRLVVGLLVLSCCLARNAHIHISMSAYANMNGCRLLCLEKGVGAVRLTLHSILCQSHAGGLGLLVFFRLGDAGREGV